MGLSHSSNKVYKIHGIEVPYREVELDPGDEKLSLKAVRKNAMTAAYRGEVSALIELMYHVIREVHSRKKKKVEVVLDSKIHDMQLADIVHLGQTTVDTVQGEQTGKTGKKKKKKVMVKKTRKKVPPLRSSERAIRTLLILYATLAEGIPEGPNTKVGFAMIPVLGNGAQMVISLLIFLVIPMMISCPPCAMKRVWANWLKASMLAWFPLYGSYVIAKRRPVTNGAQTLIVYLTLRQYMRQSTIEPATDEKSGRKRMMFKSDDLERYLGDTVRYPTRLHKYVVGDLTCCCCV